MSMAKIVKSDDKFLVIRTQRTIIKSLIASPIIPMSISVTLAFTIYFAISGMGKSQIIGVGTVIGGLMLIIFAKPYVDLSSSLR